MTHSTTSQPLRTDAEPSPLNLTWVARGEVIEVEDLAGRREPQMVMSSCDIATRGYRCVTCNRQLANVGNLVMHIEHGGTHRIVTWCSTHRLFECADRSQVEAFAKIIPRAEQIDAA